MRYLLLLVFLCPTWVYALESSDRLRVRIIKVYEKNVLVLNRGMEDGIFPKDHIKLTNPDGFIARGVCIKSGMLSSHYKIYRVVRPELVSKDSGYKLTSINQSEMPKDIERMYKEVDFTYYYEDWDEKDLQKQLKLQQKRLAQYDLPEDTKNDPIIEDSKKTGLDRFVEKNFSRKQLAKDFETLYFTVYASPYSVQSLNNQQDLNYGVDVLNKGEKYDFAFDYNTMRRKMVNPFNKSEVDHSRKNYSATFEIKDFSESWNYVAMLRYDDSRYGGISNPREHTQLGLMGFKYISDYTANDDFTDFTYVFFLDQRKDDTIEPVIVGTAVVGQKINQETNTNVRHGFRWRTRGYFDTQRTFAFDNELWWQPLMDLSRRELSFDDVDMYNRFRISLKASDKFFIDYENHYSYDINQKVHYGIEPTVITNVFNFRYMFEL
jgi:hypothetical protein